MEDIELSVEPMQAAYESTYVQYTNHIMGCPKCYAPLARYCDSGTALLLESDARYLMTMSDLNERKRLILREHARRPAYAQRLKERVIELFSHAQEDKAVE